METRTWKEFEGMLELHNLQDKGQMTEAYSTNYEWSFEMFYENLLYIQGPSTIS